MTFRILFTETGIRSEPKSPVWKFPWRFRRHPAKRIVQEADVERPPWQQLLRFALLLTLKVWK